MATVTLTPNETVVIGSGTTWDGSGYTSEIHAVLADDTDTTYLWPGVVGSQIGFDLPATIHPATISKIEVHHRYHNNSSYDLNFRLVSPDGGFGLAYVGFAPPITSITAATATWSDEATVNLFRSKSALTGIEIVISDVPYEATPRVYRVRMDITHDEAPVPVTSVGF